MDQSAASVLTAPGALTGRVQAAPDQTLHDEVLYPQFLYEMKHYLPHYLLAEKALLLEYARMELITGEEMMTLSGLLNQADGVNLVADPEANMSDMFFTIEKFVSDRLPQPVATWHVDRSRNDLQACVQVMFTRAKILEFVGGLLELFPSLHRLALETLEKPMPGYTHYQSAQVISPGFYFSAVTEQVLDVLRHLLFIYDDLNQCPLGAGAMAGHELPWDRRRLANLLGFSHDRHHALLAVGSRDWALRVAGELSTFGVAVSRIVTDLITWGSSGYGFITLPDEMCGISSAMPQKKNFTILERIRGKCAHLSTYYLDIALGQRNTPLTNLVEVNKEALSQMNALFQTAGSIVRLLHMVIDRIGFNEAAMRQVCEQDYLGGFGLANALTLHYGVPYRQAQVLTGAYITESIARHLNPAQVDADMLHSLCLRQGYDIKLDEEEHERLFQADFNLRSKHSAGSAHPDSVLRLLERQSEEYGSVAETWTQRKSDAEQIASRLERIMKNESEANRSYYVNG